MKQLRIEIDERDVAGWQERITGNGYHLYNQLVVDEYRKQKYVENRVTLCARMLG